MKIEDLIVLRTPPSLRTSPPGYLLYVSHVWNTWSRHVALLIPRTSAMPPLSRCLVGHSKKYSKIIKVSHGVLKKGLKNHLNPPFLYRLGGLKNSTTIKQEPYLYLYLRGLFGEWKKLKKEKALKNKRKNVTSRDARGARLLLKKGLVQGIWGIDPPRSSILHGGLESRRRAAWVRVRLHSRN